VVDITSEKDPAILRQVAQLQERELTRLRDEVVRLRAELARLRGETPEGGSQQELELMRELLALREQELFGRSSEKRPHLGADEVPATPAVTPKPRRGHGPTPQPTLPHVEVAHELPEAERGCPACGGTLVELAGASEDCEEVTVVERQFVLRTIKRQKYRCACNGAVVTAPAPARLIPGGRYSTELAVASAVDKYLDHLPLERQVRAMARVGLEVTSQALWDQHQALARVLEPTYLALWQRVRGAEVVYADETRWRLLDGTSSPHWVWSLVGDSVAFYRICVHRSAQAAEELLGPYAGIVMADGFSAYLALAKDRPFTLVHCWAHVRRKFVEAQSHAPDLANAALGMIQRLYEVEAEVPRAGPRAGPDEVARERATRLTARQERSRPITAQLRDWAWVTKGSVLPKSPIGKAVDYMLSLWPRLTLFLDDARIPLDNNAVERALRGPVIGRKNFYGSKSTRGTQVAALLYTLTESAKLARVDPRAYLLRATRAALEAPGTVTLPAALLDS
jgi:transposase